MRNITKKNRSKNKSYKSKSITKKSKTFKKNDASAETDMKLYKNFKEGSVITYLRKRKSLEKKFHLL